MARSWRPGSGQGSRHGDVPVFAGYPTAYLLSRPAVESSQFSQAGPCAVGMMRQHVSAGARNVEETQVTRQETVYCRLIGRVENGPTGAAAPRDFITQLYGRECVVIDLLEMKSAQFAPVQPTCRPADALRVGQGVLNRQTH